MMCCTLGEAILAPTEYEYICHDICGHKSHVLHATALHQLLKPRQKAHMIAATWWSNGYSTQIAVRMGMVNSTLSTRSRENIRCFRSVFSVHFNYFFSW